MTKYKAIWSSPLVVIRIAPVSAGPRTDRGSAAPPPRGRGCKGRSFLLLLLLRRLEGAAGTHEPPRRGEQAEDQGDVGEVHGASFQKVMIDPRTKRSWSFSGSPAAS